MKRVALVSVLLSFSLIAFAAPVKVDIDTGTLLGNSEDGVNTFRGVPFAQPPVGKLRWKAPQPVAKWTGDYDATEFKLPCPQPTNERRPNGGGVIGATSEDCLYLNVTAPANADKAPVMVWLYGGASYLGAGSLGSYNAPTFAKNGVIMVTTNYRLGPLAYFAHPAVLKAAKADEPVANYALMDAIATLEWVQRNIEQFGGDPNNVTVFGQSAGGFMVVNLLGIPSAKPLFHKAGVQSGAALRPGMSLDQAKERAIEWATSMGLDGANATLEELQAIPVNDFAQDRTKARSLGAPEDGRLKTKSTLQAFEDGTANYVPLLIGSNNGERGFDGARDVATAMSKKAPAFLYQFGYVPEWRKEAQPNGAPHSAEIVYVFDSWDQTSLRVENPVQPIDRQVAIRVNSCWVAFAKASVDAKTLNCADGYTWPSYDSEGDAATYFEATPKVVKSKELRVAPPQGSPRGSMAPN